MHILMQGEMALEGLASGRRSEVSGVSSQQ
jgi:hypothetical protein